MNLREWDAQTKGGRAALAQKLGVTVMTISNLVNGKYKPSLEQIIAINEVTGLTVTELDKELSLLIETVMERGVL